MQHGWYHVATFVKGFSAPEGKVWGTHRLMSLARGDSARSMVSRGWSTSDLVRGLEHVLTDGKNELPDDLAQLEERYGGYSKWSPLLHVVVVFGL